MTANHEHTPTTERVRGLYAAAVYEFNVGGPEPDPDAEFDRWHAAQIAAAEKRGATKALREAAKDWRWSAWKDTPKNPIAAANYTGDWIENRADLLEGDDD